MSVHTATIEWRREGNDHPGGRHGTTHVWRFDGGAEVPASASPEVVKPPHSSPEAVDPEEGLIAAASSCHMLFFLAFAAKEGYPVAAYTDAAEGTLAKTEAGPVAITHIRLRPRVRYVEAAPDRATETALHDKAHHACFVANSLRTTIETVLKDGAA